VVGAGDEDDLGFEELSNPSSWPTLDLVAGVKDAVERQYTSSSLTLACHR
jgi:hypothetical protein